jgi:hypothetical protein
MAAHSRSRCVRIAALITVVVVLTGCGSGTNPMDEVTSSATRTGSLSGVGYTVTFSDATLFPGSLRLLGGNAVYDLRSGVGYEAVALRAKDGVARTLYFDFLPSEFDLAPVPAPAGALPEGKSWVSVRFRAGAQSASDATLAAQATGLAPELALDEIAWGIRSARSAGSEVVGHVPMTEYRASINLSKALASARRAQRPALAAAIEGEIRATPSKSISARVWVNGPGYIAKIEVPLPGTRLGTASFLFTGFNAKFKHTLPPPSETVPFSSLSSSRSLWAIVTGS